MDRGERLRLIFLWHMHQPLYRNGITGEYQMPWVFLHSIKDYYDMPWHLSKFNLKAAFNLTPVLIEQIEEYGKGGKRCRFIYLMRKEVKELSLKEKEWLLQFLFRANLETMIKPLKDYYKLFLHREISEEFLSEVSNQDFLNLQVLFLLSWCGKFLRENSKVVKRLLEKESVFTQKEKEELLNELLQFTGKVIPLYRELYKKGQIEITTTPYYHPILPLLIDINCAREATPEVKLPALHVNFSDDAREQVERGLKKSRDVFGEVKGVWPAEGGVSGEALELLKEKGVSWSATDEEILFKSLQEKTGSREPLYRVYSYKGLKLLFRDRELSDLIGFTYKSWREEDAVNDFISRLERIRKEFKGATVSVILDGENCWEFYRENGYPFRELLYQKLQESPFIETVLPREVEAERELKRIFPGSWIGGNFLTWIGEEEKNRAWELVGITKLMVEKEREREGYLRAKEKLLAAEGSDWFWWFGEGHYTPFKEQFEELFKSSLIGALKELELEVPRELLLPISKKREEGGRAPKNYLKPEVDGRISNYYEWLEAGKVRLADFSTMESSAFLLKELYYGYDEEGNLYLRVDGRWQELKGKEFRVRIRLYEKEEKEFVVEGERVLGCEGGKAKVDKVLEVEIPRECLGELSGKVVYLRVILEVEGKVKEELPLYAPAKLVLNRDFSTEWMV
ncbi:glycoside hydrolase family 57 protein [Thermovibrio sp.]